VSARQTSIGIEVEMPVVYPTGDCVTVVVTVDGGHYLVHDAGFGDMYLTSQGVSLTSRMSERLGNLAAHYGCEFINGRMSRRCTEDQLALAIAVVANASRTIGDQVFDAAKAPIFDYRRAVADRVRGIVGTSRVLENENFAGDSGTLYRVTAAILDKAEKNPTAFIEPIRDHDSVSRRFREFYDLSKNPEIADAERIALYDDSKPWSQGDLIILRDVGQVIRLSDADQLLRELAA